MSSKPLGAIERNQSGSGLGRDRAGRAVLGQGGFWAAGWWAPPCVPQPVAIHRLAAKASPALRLAPPAAAPGWWPPWAGRADLFALVWVAIRVYNLALCRSLSEFDSSCLAVMAGLWIARRWVSKARRNHGPHATWFELFPG